MSGFRVVPGASRVCVPQVLTCLCAVSPLLRDCLSSCSSLRPRERQTPFRFPSALPRGLPGQTATVRVCRVCGLLPLPRTCAPGGLRLGSALLRALPRELLKRGRECVERYYSSSYRFVERPVRVPKLHSWISESVSLHVYLCRVQTS